MRKIFFIFLIAAFCVPFSAQTKSNVKIQGNNLGKVTVLKGKTRSVIDLSSDVSGCVFVPKEFKKDLDKKGCTASPATFKLIDATEKNKQTFLILTADEQENCNVCGRCGASEATTVIWLKLDARLKLLEKKNLPLEYCGLNLSMIYPDSETNKETADDSSDFSFKGNMMTIEFERRLFNEESNGDVDMYEFTLVEYDRTKPENGLVIKTEKRDKSSLPN